MYNKHEILIDVYRRQMVELKDYAQTQSNLRNLYYVQVGSREEKKSWEDGVQDEWDGGKP